ncbi:MAG: D-alanyl-D-alanine carboxypeptidase, partial [Cohnella sp.]|nr:D-alanyl-D-alanine carboxypeptidase [Cohnella sp.]
FDYAFAQYTNVPIYKKGDAIGEFTIEKGATQKVPLVAKHPYSILLRKGDAGKGIRHELVLNRVQAPLRAGDPVGKLVVYRNDEVIKEFPVESPVAVSRAGWWKLFKRATGKLFLAD